MRSSAQLLFMTLLVSCSGLSARAGETLTSKDGRVQIQLPEGYSEKTPPKPTIKIEAVDGGAGATLLVISENQKDFASLAEYGEIVRGQMMERLKDPQGNAGEKLEIGDHPAIRYEITGISSNGMRMAFLVTVIQTETRFNQVVGSCMRVNFADHKADFVKVAETLKELPPKPDERSHS